MNRWLRIDWRRPGRREAGYAAFLLVLVWAYATHIIPPVFSLIDRGEFLSKFEVTPALREQVAESLAREMETRYIYAGKGRAAALRVRTDLATGKYDELRDPRAFCDELTLAVRGDTDDDRNLRVVFTANPIPAGVNGSTVVDARAAWDAQDETTEINTLGLPTQTDGVGKVDILKTNVGYVRINHFNGGEAAAQHFAQVLQQLHDTRALVLDLRDNTGGSSESAVQLASYFFPNALDVVGVETRVGPAKWEQRTLATRPVPAALAYLKQPVIVLTSRETISAAETLAYVLKRHGRAKILGESTRGAAHPAERFRLSEHFGATVPTARIYDPGSAKSWETSGVIPDRYMLAYQALDIVKNELAFKGEVKTTPDP